MKKTLAILLTVCMAFMLMPFFAFAEDTVYLTDETVPENYYLASYTNYIVKYDPALSDAENTFVVPYSATLHIVNSCTVTVQAGATLSILGDVIIHEGGRLIVDGFIENADKITNNGVAEAKVTFPSLESVGLNGKIEVSYAVSFSGSAYDDIQEGALQYTPVTADGADIYMPLNEYVYIIAHIIEPVAGRDKFDDSLMKVRLNGVEIPYTQGNHHTLLTVGGKISYSQWTSDNDFLNTYRIDLPNKAGYTVYGREGEVGSTDTTVYLKYGKPFSFRVVLDDAYSKSPVEVYIVRGYGWTNMDTSVILADLEPAQPDADGYYTIPSVESDYTVFVMGVVENATVEKVSGIFEQVKSIFEMIRKFFAQFLALFGVNA